MSFDPSPVSLDTSLDSPVLIWADVRGPSEVGRDGSEEEGAIETAAFTPGVGPWAGGWA